MGLSVKLEVKQLFFDRDRVIRATDRAQRRALTRIGGFTRTTARRSIRKRKGKSSPGKPPHSHSGELRDGIFFVYEPRSQSVVIGPVGFGTGVPEVLEYGGNITVSTSRRGEPERRKRIKIEARPTMGPAEQKARERIPDAFRDSIRS